MSDFPSNALNLTAAERRQWEIARGMRSSRLWWLPVVGLLGLSGFAVAAVLWFQTAEKPYGGPVPAALAMSESEAMHHLYSRFATKEARLAHERLTFDATAFAYDLGLRQGQVFGIYCVVAAFSLVTAAVIAFLKLRRPHRDPRDTLIRKLQDRLDEVRQAPGQPGVP